MALCRNLRKKKSSLPELNPNWRGGLNSGVSNAILHMHVYVAMHVYVHLHLHLDAHVHVHVKVHVHVDVRVWPCVYTYGI